MSRKNLATNLRTAPGRQHQTLVQCPLLTRQPVSPKDLRITEDLLFSINSYISGMYNQKAWLPVRYDYLDTSSDRQGDARQTLDKFYAGCMSAFTLLQAKSFVEGQKVLSNACSLVRSIILSSHPETLGRFLDIFHDLQREKFGPLTEVLNLLRSYVGRMAMEILPRGHPWRNICCLLGRIEMSNLDQTMLVSIKSVADVSAKEGGRFSNVHLRDQLLYVQWAHGNHLSEEERALRQLLSEVQVASSCHPQIFSILQYLSINLRKQGRFADCETLGKEKISLAQSYGTTQNLFLGFLITAMAQYSQGKNAQAEANQRQAVSIQLAQSDPQRFTWAIRHLAQLESWLREWGRLSDAEETKAEIDSLIKQDTAVEEELLGINEEKD